MGGMDLLLFQVHETDIIAGILDPLVPEARVMEIRR